jgi:hypothetical protein
VITEHTEGELEEAAVIRLRFNTYHSIAVRPKKLLYFSASLLRHYPQSWLHLSSIGAFAGYA